MSFLDVNNLQYPEIENIHASKVGRMKMFCLIQKIKGKCGCCRVAKQTTKIYIHNIKQGTKCISVEKFLNFEWVV